MHTSLERHRTRSLVLRAPRPDDAAAVFAIASDPRVWTHFPSGRPLEVRESAAGIDRWREGGAADGLGAWLVSTAGEPDRIIGYAGCWGRAAGRLWNLGYRFAPSAQGRGFATEAAAEAVAQAQGLDAARPVVALVLEHNTGSRAVAERCGLSVRFRGRDVGNPDAAAVRLVLADRPLADEEIAAALG